MHKYNNNWDGIQRKNKQEVSEARDPFPKGFKKGEMLMVKDRLGRMVKGKLVSYQRGKVPGGAFTLQLTGEPEHGTIEVGAKELFAANPSKLLAKKEQVEIDEQFKTGDKVKVPHKGRMVSGKIVRFDSGKGTPYSPMYVVYVGEYESILVPPHNVRKESVEESWGGGFQSAADANREVQASLKADFQRERAQKLKLIVQVIRGEISKQKFRKLTGRNFDDLMKNSPYFRNQVKRMPKKALEPVKPVKEEVDISEGMQEFFDGLLMHLERIHKKAMSPSRHGNMEIMRDLETVIRELKKYKK